MLRRVLWAEGVKSDYRRAFWRYALPRLMHGDIERVIMVGLVAHHLIRFAREAASGRHNASHYSVRMREAAVAAE
jgi:hypothetical protein